MEEVKPFLIQNGLITLQQCKELHISSQTLTSAKLVEKAILMLSRHPQCASQLLKAIEAMESAIHPNSSHHQIITELKAQLNQCGQSVSATEGN